MGKIFSCFSSVVIVKLVCSDADFYSKNWAVILDRGMEGIQEQGERGQRYLVQERQ